MKKKIIFIGSLLLGIILTIIIYLSIDNVLEPFRNVPLHLFLLYIGVVLIIHVIHSYRWGLILKTMDHKIRFRKLFAFRIMGFSLNYITPTAHIGGEPLKAAMLKENNVPIPEGVSSLFIDKSLEAIANGFFALSGLFIILLSFALPKQELANLIILSLGCVMILLWVFFSVLKRKDTIYSTYLLFRLNKIPFLKKHDSLIKKTGENINHFFLNEKEVFRSSILLSLLMWFLMFVEYKILFLMLGFDATLFQLFIIISFVGLAYVIPIPAALAVLEVGQLSAFTILNLNPSLGIAAAIIIRAKDLMITLFGLSMISLKGLGALKALQADEKD